MKCDICKENKKLSLERIRGRIVQICDNCLGDYQDYCEALREDRRIENDN